MQPNRKLRVGLLLDGLSLDKYVKDLINWIEAHDQIVLSDIVINPPPNVGRFSANRSRNARRLHSLPSRLLSRVIIWAESLLLRAYAPYRDHYKEYDLRDLDVSAAVGDGPADDDRPALDLLIDCRSSGRSNGGLCQSRLGIISLDYPDCATDPRCPPGFWKSTIGMTRPALRS